MPNGRNYICIVTISCASKQQQLQGLVSPLQLFRCKSFGLAFLVKDTANWDDICIPTVL